MAGQRAANWSRREFMSGLTVAGTAGLLGVRSEPVAAEPPPETTRLRLPKYPVDIACTAPQWVAEELLRAEGFSRVEYVTAPDAIDRVAAGDLDMIMEDALTLILGLDAGKRLVALGGVHGGCFELFGTDKVKSIRDLKGKKVAVSQDGYRAFVASVASYVGLHPLQDITFVMDPEALQLFVDGKVDAVGAFPPEPQELRARRIGHSVVNTAVDRPWSQYFCCFATGNREFVRKHPVATKRALRAIVKATDICAAEPERVARFLVERGYVRQYDYSLQALKDIPYRRWREYDSADTIRFFALRMHEAGVIKSSPQKLVAENTDWRFVNELKKELKG
jgi:NitT/TauT family transport system substrate-binding protein